MDENIKLLLKKQHYGIIGENSAVKLCSWLKKSIKNEGVCYKERFYGISCHRCLQMTPVANLCNHNCLFCWRAMDYAHSNAKGFDEPREIVRKSIEAQKKLLVGYKGNPKTDIKKFNEALEPNQVAISLLGEPTLYPYLDELIKEYHRRGFTTFVVTNGTKPEAIERIKPTQLYLTLPAPNEGIYKDLCRPLIANGWERIKESLAIMGDKKVRKVIRLTMIRGRNMVEPGKYMKLIETSKAHFIEPKAYMFVGYSQYRMKRDNMPLHSEIMDFSDELAKKSDYKIVNEGEESRVALLAREKYRWTSLKEAQPF